MSAVQGARIKGASQIIAVDPIRARRELALKLGATIALDPNDEITRDTLIAKGGDVVNGRVRQALGLPEVVASR